MSKTTYLIISGLLSFNFLKNNLFPIITDDFLFIAMLMWSIFGGIYYYREPSYLSILKNQKWVFIIFILLFLSSLTPMFRYNQDLVSTWLAMRTTLITIYLLVLLKISPNEEEIFKSFKFLGILALIMVPFVVLYPEQFIDKEKVVQLLREQKSGSTDIAAMWPGSTCVVFYFYILLQKVIEDPKTRNFIWCTIFMTYIFLMQNRSTLICAIPFYAYAVYKADIKYKRWIVTLIIIISSTYIFTIIQNLLEETEKQLSNTKYNRWQAIYFFLLEHDNNPYSLLFGNGVPSKGSSYLNYILNAQHSRLAFISDIGLLGSYFYYGLGMIVIVYRFVLKAIFGRNIPKFLKYYAIWILLVPTIHYIGLGVIAKDVSFMMFFYLIIYYQNSYPQYYIKDIHNN